MIVLQILEVEIDRLDTEMSLAEPPPDGKKVLKVVDEMMPKLHNKQKVRRKPDPNGQALDFSLFPDSASR